MLSSDENRTKNQLRRIFRLRTPEVNEPPKELEDALVRRLHQRQDCAESVSKIPPSRRIWSFVGDHRWAIAGLALTVGACQMPVDYQRSFGASVDCQMPAKNFDEGSLQAMSEELRDAVGAESISLRVSVTNDEAQVRIDVWGDLEDENDALEQVRDLSPNLSDATCTALPLAGTVHGTLGGRLGYNLLSLDVLDRRGAEATRQAILEELAAQGFRGTAKVEVEDSNGQRKIKISLEEEYEHGEGESEQGEPPELPLKAVGNADEVDIEVKRQRPQAERP
ncbi:MAG TPA: hypothetical protein ENJ18_13375 [Nannocystis exedens]|nr:hypothetical protein [Nannocystis exedens]